MEDPSTEYVGTRLFGRNYHTAVLAHLHASPTIQSALSQTAFELFSSSTNTKPIETIQSELAASSNKIIAEMVADMSSVRVVKTFALTVKTMLGRMYHLGIHVNAPEVQKLKQTALECSANATSLVFMPCHKSHIDYLVVSYVLYRIGIALPHIAAGDNLNIPLVGYILRKNGAFFIRREWGGDRLYVAIMREYVDFLVTNGYNLEAFVEGTRSRTGKLLQPKFGFLKLVVDAIRRHPEKDVMLVPVSIGYDKVIEHPSYVNELLGKTKEKESLGTLFSSLNILQLKWGRIDVRFGEAFSLRQFMTQVSLPHSIKEHIVPSLGYKALSEINSITSIMPTALVGTILLTLRGRGVGRTELIRKVKWLQQEILDRGGRVAQSGKSSTGKLVDRAIEVLKELVGKRYDILESVYYPLKRFELSYYRNQVIHLFVPEAVLSIAMYATIKVGGPIRNQRIPISTTLLKEVTFLSQLLRYEFVYNPGGMAANLDETLGKLQRSNVVFIGQEGEERWVTLSDEERRTGRETFDFYCFLLWPFIETYWLCAVSLYTILSQTKSLHWVDSRVFMARSQVLGKTLYFEGDLSYFEAVNKETIANAIGWFRQLGIIKIFKGALPPTSFEPSSQSTNSNTTWISVSEDWMPSKKLPEAYVLETVRERAKPEWDGPLSATSIKPMSLQLTPRTDKKTKIDTIYYDDEAKPTVQIKDNEHNFWIEHRPEGKLWVFCEDIGRFRREGKNRRDTATVAIRVLRLAKLASNWYSKLNT